MRVPSSTWTLKECIACNTRPGQPRFRRTSSLLAGELLADAEVTVRLAAAEAVAHGANRDGAGLLFLALARPDEDSIVQLACLEGLLQLAPDRGLSHLRKLLVEDESPLAELVPVALGQSRREDALDLLLELVEGSAIATERARLLEAVGLHRSERALQYLVGIIATGRNGGRCSRDQSAGPPQTRGTRSRWRADSRRPASGSRHRQRLRRGVR